jgi:hypothetical protein
MLERIADHPANRVVELPWNIDIKARTAAS